MNMIELVRGNIANKEQERESLRSTLDRLEEQRSAGGRKSFTPGQQAQHDAASAELQSVETDLDALNARLAELEEVDTRLQAASKAPVSLPLASRTNGGGDVFRDMPDLTRADSSALRSTALRAIEQTVATDSIREGLTKSLERAGRDGGQANADGTAAWIAVASNPAYFRAWNKLVADPQFGSVRLTDEERVAYQQVDQTLRAMNITTGADGKLALPVVIDPTYILSNSGYIPLMRRLASTVTITTDRWKGITTQGVTAEWKTESAAVAVTQPALVQPDIPVALNDVFVPYSFEVEQDHPNLVEELARIATDAVFDLEEAGFWTGTGSGQPSGLVRMLDASASFEVAITTTGTFSKTDVYKAANAVPDRFWESASWAAARGTLFTVRQMADTTTGANNAEFWTDFGQSNPSTLLGRAVYATSEMSAWSATTAAQNVMVIGDFSKYRIVERGPTQVETVQHLVDTTSNTPTGERGFLMWRRVGGAPLTLNAFRLLNQ